MSVAETIEEIRNNTSPKPLSTAEELDRLFVETGPARDERSDFRDNLRDILHEDEPRTILVHGHRGCGKSTEINKLVAGLGENWLVVRVQADDFLQASGNEAADLLLAASVRIAEVAVKERGLSSHDESLKEVLRFFADTTRTEENFRDSGLDTEGGFEAQGGLLGSLLGIRAKIVASLKFGSRTAESTVYQVRRRRGELSNSFTALCLSVEHAWQQRHPDGRMLLIIEELDKIGLADARRIFVDEGRLLSLIPVRTILTIPVFTFHSPDARAIRGFFGRHLALPMIKIRDWDGQPCYEGLVVLGRLVRKRIAESALPDDALDLLIQRTGGVLRDIFLAIQTALTFKTVKATGIITLDDIGAALDRMVTEIGNQIAYPPEDDKHPAPLQQKLAEIARLQEEGYKVPSQPDQDIQLLLMSGALIEYNGTGWLGVHPLALEYIQNLPRDPAKDPG
jgi:hypothetical protein